MTGSRAKKTILTISEPVEKTSMAGAGAAQVTLNRVCQGCGASFDPSAFKTKLSAFSRLLPDLCLICYPVAEARLRAETETFEREEQAKIQEVATKRRRESWIRYLGGEEAYEDYLFDRYETEPPEIPEELHRATFRKWLNVVQTFDPFKDNLFVYGPVGTGKTHLATAKARWMLEKGGTARVMEKFKFVADVRGSRHTQPEAELLEHLEKYIDLDVLVINDIEDEPNTAKVNTIFKLLLEARSQRRKGGVIITSNKPLARKPGTGANEAVIDFIGKKNADRMDGRFLIFGIPPETPSMRGILKRRRRVGT